MMQAEPAKSQTLPNHTMRAQLHNARAITQRAQSHNAHAGTHPGGHDALQSYTTIFMLQVFRCDIQLESLNLIILLHFCGCKYHLERTILDIASKSLDMTAE
jgi:hypothetical protein